MLRSWAEIRAPPYFAVPLFRDFWSLNFSCQNPRNRGSDCIMHLQRTTRRGFVIVHRGLCVRSQRTFYIRSDLPWIRSDSPQTGRLSSAYFDEINPPRTFTVYLCPPWTLSVGWRYLSKVGGGRSPPVQKSAQRTKSAADFFIKFHRGQSASLPRIHGGSDRT